MFNSKVVHHQRACYLEPHNLLLVLHSQNSKILVCFCVIYRSRRERQMTAPNPQPALVNTFLYYCFRFKFVLTVIMSEAYCQKLMS